MTTMRYCVGLALAFGLAGCDGAGEASSAEDVLGSRLATPLTVFQSLVSPVFPGAAPTVPVDAARTTADAEYGPRVVAEVATATTPCPSPNPGWTSRRLFQTSTTAAIPLGLRRFCLYTWTGAGAAPAQAFAQGSGAESVRDHLAVSPATATTLTEVTQAGYSAEYLNAVGQAPEHAALNPVLPRIAILDTSPDSSVGVPAPESLGLNDHGYALANMVQNLQLVPIAGGTQADSTLVTTRLTMDMYVDPTSGEVVRDPIGGGDFGTIAILAEKIHEEIDAWRVRALGEPLVINLSLGWDPLYGGTGSPSSWPIDVEAVHAALYEAACEGAVVVASSGNRAGGPDGHSNPIFPAAWGTEVIQDTACADMLGGVAADYAALDDRPLVYAVGGVDEGGRDLAVSRLNSRPAIVAYGDHAVDVDPFGAFTSILTGTSVSAAVVSAVAGVAWHNLPGAYGYEIMGGIKTAGTPTLDVAPAFCPSGSCGAAMVVDMCRSVEGICNSVFPGSCANIPPSWSCSSPVVDGTPDPADLAAFTADAVALDLEFDYAPRVAGPCSSGAIELYSEDPWRADDPCPHHQYYDFLVEPWTDPQPTHDTCPPCYIDTGSGQVYLEWEGRLSDLDTLSLYLKDASGTLKSYTTKSVPPTDSVVYSVSPSLFVGVETAWITGVIGDQSYSAGVELR